MGEHSDWYLEERRTRRRSAPIEEGSEKREKDEHGDEARDDSDTETSDNSTGDKGSPVRNELNSDTDEEDAASADETELSTERVTDGVGQEGTEEGSGRENRDDEGLVTGGEVILGRRVKVGIGTVGSKDLEPSGHSNDSRDGSSVEAEQNSTKGCKGSEQDGESSVLALNTTPSTGGSSSLKEGRQVSFPVSQDC